MSKQQLSKLDLGIFLSAAWLVEYGQSSAAAYMLSDFGLASADVRKMDWQDRKSLMKLNKSMGTHLVVLSDEQEYAFDTLNKLPDNDVYWDNKLMFTRPVFLANSTMGTNPTEFFEWLDDKPAKFKRFVMSVSK